jgi:hypothetical protein
MRDVHDKQGTQQDRREVELKQKAVYPVVPVVFVQIVCPTACWPCSPTTATMTQRATQGNLIFGWGCSDFT